MILLMSVLFCNTRYFSQCYYDMSLTIHVISEMPHYCHDNGVDRKQSDEMLFVLARY